MTTEGIPPEQMPPAALGITVEQAKAAADTGARVRLWNVRQGPCRPFESVVREVRIIAGEPFVLLDGQHYYMPCSHCEMAEGET